MTQGVPLVTHDDTTMTQRKTLASLAIPLDSQGVFASERTFRGAMTQVTQTFLHHTFLSSPSIFSSSFSKREILASLRHGRA
jgi:hypothetical protein